MVSFAYGREGARGFPSSAPKSVRRTDVLQTSYGGPSPALREKGFTGASKALLPLAGEGAPIGRSQERPFLRTGYGADDGSRQLTFLAHKTLHEFTPAAPAHAPPG